MFTLLSLTASLWAVHACAIAPPIAPEYQQQESVFSDLEFEDALEEAIDNGKLLVVSAVASWSSPCTRMQASWQDSKFLVWLGEHAIAIQFDIEQDPDLTRYLGAAAVPTVILYREMDQEGNEIEFERKSGFQTAEQLTNWFRLAKRGIKSADWQGAGNWEDIKLDERYQNALLSLKSQRYGETLREVLWLWRNALFVDPEWDQKRQKLKGPMQDLVANFPAARRTIAHIRDPLTSRAISQAVQYEELTDWVILNQILGESQRSLLWLDTAKKRPYLQEKIVWVEEELYHAFLESRKFADAGRILQNPLALAKQSSEILTWAYADNERGNSAEAAAARVENNEKMAMLYAVHLLAERKEEAAAIANYFLSLDSSGQAHRDLVHAAVEMNRAESVHHQWLDQAREKGKDIRDLKNRLLQIEATKQGAPSDESEGGS